MPTRFLAILFSALILWCVPSTAQQRSLDLNTRTGYPRAIEEVYWKHRIWPNENLGPEPFLDQLLSPDQLQARTEDALRMSSALEKYWHFAISGPQLQAEIVRMAENSHQPEVLQGLFLSFGK
jgi:hypothetical protein